MLCDITSHLVDILYLARKLEWHSRYVRGVSHLPWQFHAYLHTTEKLYGWFIWQYMLLIFELNGLGKCVILC